MRLDFALLADAASAVDGKLYVLGGGISHVTAPHLPWVQSLAICLRLVVEADEDLVAQREAELSIFDPNDRQILGPAKVLMASHPPPPPAEETPEGFELSMVLALTINGIPLHTHGIHRIELSVDDVPATLRFIVRPPA
jgi:hypothetical protein